jgi:cytochrome c-type biogenesis protein CcmH/NrfF
LLDPPRTGWGIALWAVPLGIAVVGGVAVYGLKRKEPDTAEVRS